MEVNPTQIQFATAPSTFPFRISVCLSVWLAKISCRQPNSVVAGSNLGMGSKMRGGSIQRIVQGPDTKQEPDNIMRRVVGSAALPGAGQHVRKGDADVAAIHPSPHSTFSCEMDHFGISLLGCSFANPRRAESLRDDQSGERFSKMVSRFFALSTCFYRKEEFSFFTHTTSTGCIVHRE